MKFISLSALAVLFLFNLSCNRGDGGPPSNPIESGVPSGGIFAVEKEVTDLNALSASLPSCEGTKGYDPRLTPGMSFVGLRQQKTSTQFVSDTGKWTVKVANANTLTKAINIISAQGEGAQPGFQFEDTCKLDSTGNESCAPSITIPDNAFVDLKVDCEGNLDGKYHYYVGTYTFNNGKKVTAYQQVFKGTGNDMDCISYKGTGPLESNYITTYDLVSDTPEPCRFTDIFQYHKLKKPDGTVAVGFVYETLEAP